MSELNPQQKAAVEHTSGPLLVLAGAGSGKTRVITEKIAFLIRKRGLPAEKIAAITFTNKAAKEMRKRAGRMLNADTAKGLTISTFHALGWKMLLKHAKDLGYRPGISILDEQDTQGLVRDMLPDNTAPELIQAARNQISRWKNKAMDAAAAEGDVESSGEAGIWQLYNRYEQQLRDLNAVDFDDLILLPLRLLDDPDLAQFWQQRLRYLLVDEYQDTNETQYQLLHKLAGERGALTAVGDDDQSIYGWRGAQPENLNQLAVDYPNLQVIKLEQNYRSTGKILKAANTVIANNPHTHEKRLWSALHEGEDIQVIPCEDDKDEASRIVSEILHRQFTSKAHYGDFAILYRGNHQSRVLEQALREQRIPYHLSGGTSFFDRAEIKDLLCYLRLVINPDDNTAFMRCINTPRRDLGAASLTTIAQHAGQQGVSLFEAALRPDCRQALRPKSSESLRRFCNLLIDINDRGERGDPMAAIEDLVDTLCYREWIRDQAETPEKADRRIANIDELMGWLRRLNEDGDPNQTLTDLIGRLSLMTNLDQDEEPGQQVRLMTLHAAKGLEFPHVFMAGVEEDLLPHRNSLEEGAEEEERRLMYVGITRARETLAITFARKRRRYGEDISCEPSRFLDELPKELIRWKGEDPQHDEEESKARAKSHLANLKEMFGR